MILNQKLSLKGYIVGIQVLEKGVVVQDVPAFNTVEVGGKKVPCVAPNMILNSGRDHIAANPISYCFGWAARGTSSTPAAVGQKFLGAQLGNRTNAYVAGAPNCGTAYDRENGIIKMRRTYDFPMETSDQAINEIGFAPYNAAPSDTADNYALFSRIVLPVTVSVLTGQQLRVTYELTVTLSPITDTAASPAITGWVTDGVSRLMGYFPVTNATYTSDTNSFLASVDTNGEVAVHVVGSYAAGNSKHGLFDKDKDLGWMMMEPSQSSSGYNYSSTWGSTATDCPCVFLKSAHPAVSAFGNWMYTDTGYYSSAFYNAGNPIMVVSNHPSGTGAPGDAGTQSSTKQAYVAGNYYRDTKVIIDPNFPGGASLPTIHAVWCKGLLHRFTNPVSKTNTQRLTLNFRLSW